MKVLIFVTGTFPYGKGETFIENEIPFLVKVFDKVGIYATQPSAEDIKVKRIIPQNVIVAYGNSDAVSMKTYPFSLLKKKIRKEIRTYCGFDLHKIASCLFFDQTVERGVKNIDTFLEQMALSQEDEIVIYSYWLSTVGMTALKLGEELGKRQLRYKVVARTHGYDLYDERAYLSYQPFQRYMIEHIDKVFPCSENGSKYLKKKYPDFSSKIDTAYLGIEDRFKGHYPDQKEMFHIVSCSNVIPLKRVSRIVEALKEIEGTKMKWTHFGDGELLEEVKKSAKRLPDNIVCEFMGRVPNGEIYNYYSDHDVNLFINVSSSEGLPVSIMEAISFGIPAIATDVGGTSEIVENGINGFLIPGDFENRQLTELIRGVCSMGQEQYQELCGNARNTYETNFQAERNYTLFCKKLME